MADQSAATPAARGPAQRLYLLYTVLVPTLAFIGARLSPPDFIDPALDLLRASPPLWLAVRISLFLSWIVYVGLAAELIRPPRQTWLALLLTFDTPALMALGALISGKLDASALCLGAAVELVSVELGLLAVVFFGNTRVEPKQGVAILAALALVGAFAAGAIAIFAALWWTLWTTGDVARAALMALALVLSTIAAGRRLLDPQEAPEDAEVYILLGIAGPIFGGILFGIALGLMRG